MTSPLSAFAFALKTSKKAVKATEFFDIKAILSPLLTIRLILLKRFFPSDFLFKLSNVKTWFPASLS